MSIVRVHRVTQIYIHVNVFRHERKNTIKNKRENLANIRKARFFHSAIVL